MFSLQKARLWICTLIFLSKAAAAGGGGGDGEGGSGGSGAGPIYPLGK